MKFVDSPKVEYQPDGLPRARVSKKPLFFRILIGIALLVALTLNVYVFFQADLGTIALSNNSGAEGMVIDAENRPLANVLVFSAEFPTISTTTDANGRFQLSHLPAGINRLVVVRNNVGQEFFVTLNESKMTRVDYLAFTAPLEDIE
ncbi:MAG: carboxypeptidase regulatory-like domain-containing protein [Anaerolineales bacterium]|nr:carboxypeptidase regulatory-like domain-containing protein [Anaerolineales bacterium]